MKKAKYGCIDINADTWHLNKPNININYNQPRRFLEEVILSKTMKNICNKKALIVEIKLTNSNIFC